MPTTPENTRERLAKALTDGIAHALCSTIHHGKGWCPNCHSRAETIYAPMVAENSILPLIDTLLCEQREGIAAAIEEARDNLCPAGRRTGRGHPMTLTLTVTGTPAPQGSKRGFYNPKLNRVQMVESSSKVKPWRQDVKAAALNTIAEGDHPFPFPLLGPVRVDVIFWMPRPKAHYRTGKHAHELRPNAPVYVDKKPDVDKTLRSTFDALKEAGVYRDDAQVAVVTAEMRYATGRPAGADVHIVPLDPHQAAVPAEPPTAGTAPHHPAEEAMF